MHICTASRPHIKSINQFRPLRDKGLFFAQAFRTSWLEALEIIEGLVAVLALI